MKKEQKLSVTAIIFYVFAVLFLAYSAFMIFTAYEYVAGYVEQGTISYGKDFKDILSVYVQQAGPYLVYALLLYGIGYIIDVVTKIKGSMGMEVKEVLSMDSKDYKTAKLENKEKAIAVKEEAVKTVKPETKKASKKDDVKKEEPKKDEKAEAKKENTKADAKKETKPKSTKTKAKKADTEKTDKTKPQEKKEESAEAVETK